MRLLEGLEISIVGSTEARLHNKVFRFDAEYFKKENLAALALLRSRDAVPISDFARVTDGVHQSLPFVEDGPVRVLSAKHPKRNYIDRSHFETVDEAFQESNPRTALREGDVVLSTVGTIGNAAVITADLLPANCDRHLGVIRSRTVSPYTLSTFLNGRYGKIQTMREATGNVQLNLFISKIDELLYPRFSPTFEEQVRRTTEHAYNLRQSSRETAQKADLLFEEKLGLTDWRTPDPLFYESTLRAVQASDRMDAEFFSPAIALLRRKLSPARQTLGDIATQRREPFTALDGVSFGYIDIGSITQDGSAEVSVMDGSEAPSRAAWKVHDGDVITSLVRPARKLSALIDASLSGAICSSGFAVLKPVHTTAEVLLTYLRLPAVLNLMSVYTTASMYPAISTSDLMALPFPDLDRDTTNRIGTLWSTARQSRERSDKLLDRSTRAIDIAIERGESAALEFLRSD